MDVTTLIIPGPGPFLPVAVLDGDDPAATYAAAKERSARHLAAARLHPYDMTVRHELRSALARANFAYRRLTGKNVNNLPEPDMSEVVKRALVILRANQET